MSEAKELRAKTIEEIKSKIENSNGFIVVSYKGISVNDDVALRAKLRAANVEYKVLKNRLVNKALEELGIEGFANDLQEPNAFAFANGEITAAAKVFKDTMATVSSLSECALSISSTAVFTVRAMFVPVSPSGTGKTFNSLMCSFCASRFFAPARNIFAISFASKVFTATS